MAVVEAGKRLLASGGGRALSVTVLVMRPQRQRWSSRRPRSRATYAGRRRRRPPASTSASIASLPPTDHEGPVEFISRAVELHVPHVRAAVSGLPSVAALVLDLFCTPLIDVAHELAVPAYVYFTCNAAALSFFLRLPALLEEVAGEFEEMEGAADIPGLPPVPPLCLPTPVMERA